MPLSHAIRLAFRSTRAGVANERELIVTPQILLTIALLLAPRSHAGELATDYEARLSTITTAVADTTVAPHTWGWSWGRKQLAAALLVHMDAESGFDLRVHAGERHPRWTQDSMRARCLGQLQRSANVPNWDSLTGTDDTSTHHCVAAAALVLSRMARLCVGRAPMTEAGMAVTFEAMHGAGCKAPSAQSMKRAREFTKVMARL